MLATDYLRKAKFILESEQTLAFLNSHNVGIIRISGSQNPFFLDGDDQNESNPFFELTLNTTDRQRTVIDNIKIENVKQTTHHV